MNPVPDRDTLAHALRIVHMMDDSADEHENLYDILRQCLRGLVREFACETAFIGYRDFFGKDTVVAVDRNGLLRRTMNEEIAQMCRATEREGVTDEAKVVSLFEAPYLVKGLYKGETYLGIIGIQSGAPDGCFPFLLSEASYVLDSVIYSKCKEDVARRERTLVREIDGIVDTHGNNTQRCLELSIHRLVEDTASMAGFVFHGEEEDYALQATDSTGGIILENYDQARLEIVEAAQDCDHKDTPVSRGPRDGPIRVGGDEIAGVIAVPLTTRAGEKGGIIVLVSDSRYTPAHVDLVQSAGELLDTALIKERHIRVMVSRFTKHVGTGAIDVLLNQPKWLDPRREEVVILSADLVGSTEYAHAQEDPLKVFAAINCYLALIGKIIKDGYGGTLDKFIGDEVMALFGAPIKDVKAAETSVACAREILAAVNELSKSHEAAFEVKVTLGLVDAIVGELGSEDTQTDYTVIGDGVNQFFRIAKNHAQPGRIICNERLAKAPHIGDVSHIDEISVKGIDAPISNLRNRDTVDCCVAAPERTLSFHPTRSCDCSAKGQIEAGGV